MSENFQEVVLRELGALFDPLLDIRDDPEQVFALANRLGWDLNVVLGSSPPAFFDALEALAEARDEIEDTLEAPPQTIDELQQALTKVTDAISALNNLATVLRTARPSLAAADAERFALDLLHWLLLHNLARRAPAVWNLGYLLTLIEIPLGEVPENRPLTQDGEVLRYPVAALRLRLDRLSKLITDPAGLLKAEYLPGPVSDHASAREVATKLFERVKWIIESLGGTAAVGKERLSVHEAADPATAPLERMMSFAFLMPLGDGTYTSLGAALSVVPASPSDLGGPGLLVSPWGDARFETTAGSWEIGFQMSAGIDGVLIKSNAVDIIAPSTSTRVGASLKINKGAAEQAAFLVGSTTGTRMEVGQFSITGDADLDAQAQDYGFLIEAARAALVVVPGDGDGFLQEVLPREGLRTDFDLALGWSNRSGLHFRGSAGLEATLPVKASLLGLVTVDSVYLALRAGEPAVEAVLATTASVNLGPFAAGIERVGLRAEFTFPETSGNLGPANVELDFKPPNGVGLAIDSGVIVGGGYLFFDPENQQYAGILQLEFGETISLTAIGLLTTRMPDGSTGFSLLAIVFAEGFSPIPLGFGFTLTGVGGLLGANRTTMVDTMRAGLKNGTMGSILFPSDPIRNAPQIISDLSTVFPPAPERHLFGPMAIIGWGSPTLLTLEIALLLELPEPVRLILLGRLTAMLPSEEEALVRVRMDAIGVVDFGRGEISLDASLYDSRILMFALTGDMAMRMSLGERPNFVLAIGGFNPRFAAPPGLPRLSRLALSLATGDNPRLRLEAYLALTSNTVQFGARLELLATAGPFSLEGLLGFDALFQFDPFQFIADLVAGVALRYEGRILMAVHLDAALSGPAPWHVRGSASFQFLLFKVSVAFDARFGPQPPPAELPEPADVLGMLADAFADPGNWSGELAPNARPLVSLRPAVNGKGPLLVHPLARPTVRQRVAPLGQTIEKFGNRRLEAGPRAYTVAAVAEDGHALLSTTAVADMFALGQFREMSDDEKLSRPSFERFDSGLCFGDDTLNYHHDRATDGTFGYEQQTIDPGAADGAIRREEEPHLMPAAVFDAVVGLGAAGQAPVRRTGAARYRDAAPMVGSPVTR